MNLANAAMGVFSNNLSHLRETVLELFFFSILLDYFILAETESIRSFDHCVLLSNTKYINKEYDCSLIFSFLSLFLLKSILLAFVNLTKLFYPFVYF